jgi:hypothetical protein
MKTLILNQTLSSISPFSYSKGGQLFGGAKLAWIWLVLEWCTCKKDVWFSIFVSTQTFPLQMNLVIWSFTTYILSIMLSIPGRQISCFKSQQSSGWRVMAPCRDTEDAFIIFVRVQQIVQWNKRERVERTVPEETKQTFCQGLAKCDISEMSKIVQGCINMIQFSKQVIALYLIPVFKSFLFNWTLWEFL